MSIPLEPAVSCDKALSIANTDAVPGYRDLRAFRIEMTLEVDGWHIHYELKDSRLNGGGPQYVIDATTGAIISKKYYQ